MSHWDGDYPHPTLNQAFTGAHPLAFDARQSDTIVYGNKSGTLDTDGHSVGVCVTGHRTHALKAEGADGSEDGTGRGNPIVVAITAMRESGQGYWMEDDIAGTLRAEGEDRPSRPSHVIQQQAMSVRRLTPTECERLQGFPDGHTLIPWKGKPASDCPDGPRYRALGNSMAVPVIAWIGKRIDAARRGPERRYSGPQRD